MSNTEFFQLFGLGILALIFIVFWITYRIEMACQRKGKDHESGEPIVTRPRVKKWVKK